MLDQSQVDAFHRDGFLNAGPLLTDAECEVLRDEVLRVIDDRDREDLPQAVLTRDLNLGGRPVWQIVDIWKASEPYERLLHHPVLTAMAGQLAGAARELRIWHDQLQYKPAETGGPTGWHQDSPLWASLQPKTAQFSAWIALDNAQVDNGCMSMVPGSHKWGVAISDLTAMMSEINKQNLSFFDLPETYQDHPVEVRHCPVKMGHVHFHHALTWHGSHLNASGRPRRAIAIHFMTEETVYSGDAGHPMAQFIEVEEGQKIVGDAFPLLWTAEVVTV